MAYIPVNTPRLEVIKRHVLKYFMEARVSVTYMSSGEARNLADELGCHAAQEKGTMSLIFSKKPFDKKKMEKVMR